MTATKSVALATGLALAGLLRAPAASATGGFILITQATARTGLAGCPNDGQSLITICKPGSYRLAGNLEVHGALDGIDVNAPHTTLDLGGFVISSAARHRSAAGVLVAARAVLIRNGKIHGFTTGILSKSVEVTVQGVDASGNFYGLWIPSGQILNSVADHCAVGISLGNGLIRGTTADDNRADGIDAGNLGIERPVLPTRGAVLVQGSVVENNQGYGINFCNRRPGALILIGFRFSVIGSRVGGNAIGIESGGSTPIRYGGDVFFANRADVNGAANSLGGNVCSNGSAC